MFFVMFTQVKITQDFFVACGILYKKYLSAMVQSAISVSSIWDTCCVFRILAILLPICVKFTSMLHLLCFTGCSGWKEGFLLVKRAADIKRASQETSW